MVPASRASLERQLRSATITAVAVLSLGLGACREKISERPAPSKPAASDAKPLLLELPAGSMQAWVESKRYRLRVLDARPCNEGGEANHGFRLAVTIEIEATPGKDASPVFASPRGAELEKNGKIFQPSLEPSTGCEALLEPKRLAPGEATSGLLVFDVPDVSYVRSGVLRFKPPRWGHESRVSVQLPDCFGSACPSLEKQDAKRSLQRKDGDGARVAEQAER